MDEFLGDLEEDVEGMQTMIYVQLQQLRESKEQISALEEENARLRAGDTSISVKTFPKKPDKFEDMENVNQNAYSVKPEADFTPMETRYYQEKTDSDLEAEYNYEGLYENEDKYQEDLENQQSAEMGQYQYEENGYKNYDEYDSQDSKTNCEETGHEAMETDDTLLTSSLHTNKTSDNGSANHLDSQTTSNSSKQENSHLSVQSSSCNSSSFQSTDNTGCSVGDIDDKDSQQILTDSQNKQAIVESSSKDLSTKTETYRKETNADNEKTSDTSRIPSPKPATKKSPTRKTATKSRNSGTEKSLNVETSNGSPNKDYSPNSNVTKQLTVDVKENTDILHSNSRSPNDKSPVSLSGKKDREPVLQKFLNGVTSTIDDIEDL